MFTWFRRKQKAILKWTLVLVIPSFVVFYGWSSITGADNTGNPADIWIGRMKPKSGGGWTYIRAGEMREARETLINFYAQSVMGMYGQNAVSMVQQLENQIPNSRIAIEAVNNAILREYARERSFMVANSEIVNYINQEFRGYTPQQAQIVLRNRGLSEAGYQDLVARKLLLEKARREVSSPAIVSVFEVWQEYSLTQTQISVAALEISASDLTDEVVIEEDALQEYFQENIETYRMPERRSYSYVKIDQNEIRDGIEPTDEELETFYNNNTDDFGIEQGVKVRQILIALPPESESAEIEQGRAEAEAILQRINAGEDFAQVANEVTDDPANTTSAGIGTTETVKLGGEVSGWIEESTTRFPEEYIQNALALSEGEVSKPIRTNRGWYILKATEKREARLPEFNEVRDDVGLRYRSQRAQETYVEARRKLAEAISAHSDFESVAAEAGLEIKQTPLQDSERLSFPEVGNFSNFDNFFLDLLPGDTVPGIMENNAETVTTFMKLDEISASHLPALDDVRESVVADFQQQEALKLAEQRAEEIRKRIVTIDDLRAEAEAMSKTLSETEGQITLAEITMSRMPQIEDFASLLVRTQPGKPMASPVSGFMRGPNTGYAVWMVTEKESPDKDEFNDQYAQLQAELLGLKRATMINEFLANQRNSMQIEFNTEQFPDLEGVL